MPDVFFSFTKKPSDLLYCIFLRPVQVDDWLREANAKEIAEEEEEERNRSSSVMSHKSGSTEGDKVNKFYINYFLCNNSSVASSLTPNSLDVSCSVLLKLEITTDMSS